MEDNGQINDILPSDDELLRRENLFLNLFEKFSVDEGSDPEIEGNDSDDSTIQDSDNGSEQSYSESSDDETEDSYDVEEIDQQLAPVIKERVNAWPEKGIHLQLRTVDPSVSVEEWLSLHSHELTTTTKKYKKTIVNNNESTTITTKKTTTTTTTIKSFQHLRRMIFRDAKNEKVKAITNGEEAATAKYGTQSVNTRDEDAYKKHRSSKEDENAKEFQKNALPVDFISIDNIPNINETKKFHSSKNHQTEKKIDSIARIVRPNKAAPPKKIKRNSPTKKNRRNEKKTEPTAVISGKIDSRSVSPDNKLEQEGTIITMNASGQSVNRKITTRSKSTSASLKAESIVVHSPGTGNILGTKIDEEFMRVTRNDYEKRIDPKILRTSAESFDAPINQRIIYKPPMTDDVEELESNSENEDELLTSYTRSGHFLRIK